MRPLLAFALLAHGFTSFSLLRAFVVDVPIGPLVAGVGGAAGLATMVAAIMTWAAPRVWWAVAGVGVVLGQAMIALAAPEPWFMMGLAGALAPFIIHGFAAEGPLSLRAAYRRGVRETPAPPERAPVEVTDLARLPPPLRRYLERAGAVGRPRPHHVDTVLRGRLRTAPDGPWMDFTAWQHDVVHPPARRVLVKPMRLGLPVDVLHAFVDGAAQRRQRLLSMVPVGGAVGAEVTRAEAIAWLADICVLAPGALVGAGFEWTAIDERTAGLKWVAGSHPVEATLHVADDGRLVEFVCDERPRDIGGGFVTRRWSTLLVEDDAYGPHRVSRFAEGCWSLPDGPFIAVEAELVGHAVDGPDPDRP